MAALQRYQQMKAEVEHAFARGGCLEGASLGGDDLSDELVRQLCDRCNDTMDPSFGSMIEWVLYEGGGPVRDNDGTEYLTDTPEALWDTWKHLKMGPFSIERVFQ
jgi:hypothetical protein